MNNPEKTERFMDPIAHQMVDIPISHIRAITFYDDWVQDTRYALEGTLPDGRTLRKSVSEGQWQEYPNEQ